MSPELATAELSRRLLNILNKTDPHECEEELKKLREELSAKRDGGREYTISFLTPQIGN